ncbi:MAG: histidine phosphatase family protein [Chloroflexota bacterium]|nr:histidine phosphatase family protein [Chloroflexota bacterium]
MSRLILVKHSLPQIDPQIPSATWRLSEVGRTRCLALASTLADYKPDAVVASVEPKALQTAQIVGQRLGLPVETAPDLQEHDRRNEPWRDDPAEFERSVQGLLENPQELVYGTETGAQALRRFSSGLAAVTGRYRDQSVAVVSHGTVISLFVAQVAGLEPVSFWRSLGLPSVVVLSQPDHRLEAVFFHLDQ